MDMKNIPMTHWLLGALIAIFVIQMIYLGQPAVAVQSELGAFRVSQIDWNFALWPGRILGGEAVWGAFTSIFLHANMLHLLFNAIVLFQFGLMLERVIGGKNLLMIFLVSGAIGSFAHIAICAAMPSFGLYGYALGASGAIFGLLGALAILEPNIKVFMMFPPMALPIGQAVVVSILFMSLVFGVNGGIAHDVHAAGLAAGAALGFYFKGKIRRDPDYTWRAVYEPKVEKDPYEWIDNYR